MTHRVLKSHRSKMGVNTCNHAMCPPGHHHNGCMETHALGLSYVRLTPADLLHSYTNIFGVNIPYFYLYIIFAMYMYIN